MPKTDHFKEARANVPKSGNSHELPGKVYLAIVLGLAVLLSVWFSWLLIRNIAPLQEKAISLIPEPANLYLSSKVDPGQFGKYTAGLEKNLSGIQKKLDKFTPREPYLVVNTSENRFWLYNNVKLVREGMCSTGSYTILTSGDKKKWIFETPRGMFRIQGKIESPVWRKPDWAFIEEGLPVPPPDSQERFESGVLGDYAMSIGHGYLIHGTLYKRFLGMPVTHGCVRLGDDDLEAVYKTLQIGSKVFIY
jgi:hypothetical protein